jgi:hypothetical protein
MWTSQFILGLFIFAAGVLTGVWHEVAGIFTAPSSIADPSTIPWIQSPALVALCFVLIFCGLCLMLHSVLTKGFE